MFYPPWQALGQHAGKMYAQLAKNSDEFGFLGQSNYMSAESSSSTKPRTMTVLYFRSYEHLHKFAHGKVHRDGWEWWDKNAKENDDLMIAHEVYAVPAGKWETIYVNGEPFDFGKLLDPFSDGKLGKLLFILGPRLTISVKLRRNMQLNLMGV
jgi:hypothetical protein